MAHSPLARSRPLGLALLVLLATASARPRPQAPAPAPMPVPLEKRGPALGTTAPAIRLRDQHDREQTLATLAGKDGLVLLFVRSADW